jgi:hypothetical protein
MQPAPRYDLHYGFQHTRNGRVARLLILLLLGIPAFGCLGAAVGAAVAWLSGAGETAVWALLIGFPVAFLLAALAGGIWIMTATSRMGAALEGSRLTVRWFRTRSADLAQARSISIQPTGNRWQVAPQGVPDSRIPALVVDTARGSLRLRLSNGEREPLPPQDLWALHHALNAIRVPGSAEAAQFTARMAERVRPL